MFVRILSGALSFKFIIPLIIGAVSLFGYGYYSNTSKTALKQQLEIANARIASFNADVRTYKKELDDKNKTISLLEKEVEREKQIGEITQVTASNLANNKAEISAQYRLAVSELNRLRKIHNGGCINEKIPKDVKDVLINIDDANSNNGVHFRTSSSNGRTD